MVRVLLAGKIAEGSLLVKCTVPVYPVAVLLALSCAVTVKLKGTPLMAVAGAVTAKWVAGPGVGVGVGVGVDSDVQLGNLKLPIRVLQLSPVVVKYSFVYQNVQSSTGSIDMAV